ncbi:preprotein translocase subunit YajC [Acidaminobacter sp. JC074]|uniref:preprotein translocase subunit YajC n=1 Tax=Acidaminobacter sp. JC074 TaxID=2530199 RepID=UPI001F10A014|nr:preprotein translocase subunit YajC [Acidaminobacter sp. JC074]MCH4888310.1 preprotein translocase subunit YajC [Acidaminobacter sp. JC074]
MGLNFALFTAAQGSILSMLPTIVIFGALLYFMIIRPQKKRQENAQNLLNSLKVGDKVQTIGGFIGEIILMEDDEYVILSEESKVRIKKNAVAIRVNPTTETEEVTSVEDDNDNDNDDDFKIDDFEI